VQLVLFILHFNTFHILIDNVQSDKPSCVLSKHDIPPIELLPSEPPFNVDKPLVPLDMPPDMLPDTPADAMSPGMLYSN